MDDTWADPTILILMVGSLATAAAGVVLGRAPPKVWAALAFVPIAARASFTAHASHFTDDAAERPASYRQSAAERYARVDPVAFPGDSVAHRRLVALEGGRSAVVILDSPLGTGHTGMRIDVLAGEGPNDIRLRARCSPFALLAGVLLPLILWTLFGRVGVAIGGAVTCACVISLITVRNDALWAFDEMETRLRRARGVET